MTGGPSLPGTGAIISRVAEARRVLWCIDFDGTLAPIARRPDLVALDRQGREVLRSLARRRDHRVAVVSGRPLGWVRRQVGIRAVYCAGNHGLEIAGPGLDFRHRAAAAARPSLVEVRSAWRRVAGSYGGALVEDKGMTVTFHYRQVRPARQEEARAAALAAARDAVPLRKLRLTEGKKVVEARPPVEWGKGDALACLLRHWRFLPGGDLVVAIGDDETDRDMFRPVRRDNGLAVFVGLRPPPPEATARLSGPAAVRNLLRRAGGLPPREATSR